MILLAFQLLLTVGVWGQSSNKLTMPDVVTSSGKSVVLPFYMDNTDEITALQFTLEIPQGCALDTGSVVLTDRKADQTVTVRDMGDNQYLFLLFSPTNKPLLGRTGKLMTITLSVPESFPEGQSYPISVKDLVLSNSSGDNLATGQDAGELRIAKSPDLMVSNVTTTVQTVKPGGTLTVGWQVENIGEEATTGGWSERVSLVKPDGTLAFLGTAYYEQALMAGGRTGRQVELDVPEIVGLDGDAVVQVRLVPNEDSGERPEAQGNNMAQAAGTVAVTKSLFWELPAEAINESAGVPIRCRLYRSGSRNTSETFSLTHSADSRVRLPQKLVIPAGQSAVSFYLNVDDNETLDKDSVVTVSLSGDNGYPPLSGCLVIADDEYPALHVTASATDVTEGETFRLTVTAERASSAPTLVRLDCETAKRFVLPQQVEIPAGETAASVDVQAVDDDIPDVDKSVAFVASAEGYVASETVVMLHDNDIPEIALELSPDEVGEAAGLTAVVATLRRLNLHDNIVTVKLSDDAEGALYFPEKTLILEKGVAEKKFVIGVVDNALVDGNRTVTVSAAVYISSCNCSAAEKTAGNVSAQLTILDDDGPSLTLTASQAVWKEGTNTGTLTVSRNTDTASPQTVTLSSNHDVGLDYEKVLTIPVGEKSISVPVTVAANTTSGDDLTVVFTAGAEGMTAGTCWVMLTDQTLPDARVTSMTVSPAEVTVGERADVSVTVTNEGAAALPSQTKINIYISGTSARIASAYTQEALEPGQSATVVKTLTLPQTPGDFTLRAVVNEEQDVKELIYLNNVYEKVALKLMPSFTATVATDKPTYVAGEAVHITGRVAGSATAGTDVEVYIINGGVRQTLTAKADAAGNFTATWQPYAMQVGHFVAGACHPGENLKTEMAAFEIYGLRRADANYITCETLAGEPYSGEVRLLNPGSLPLKNIKARVLSVPDGCTVVFEPLPEIGGGEVAALKYTVTGNVPSEGKDWAQIKTSLSTDEGAELDVLLYYYCRSPKGKLQASIKQISTTMVKGGTRDYSFTLTNVGNGTTGKISLSLPDVSWLTAVSPIEMPALAYGESATVILRFTPTETMQLNVPQTGYFGVNCTNGDGLSMAYSVEPVSESTGTLTMDVCDEYTYYTSEAPHVAGAGVVVKHPSTGAIVAQGVTGDDGLFSVVLPEGWYSVTVSDSKHDTYTNTVLVDPGKENVKVAVLSSQAVTYSWNVLETEIEDEYKIESVVKYETRVPAPVVEIKFPDDIPYANGIVYVTVTNKGLLPAHNVNLRASQSDYMRLTPLVSLPIAEVLPQEALIIPVQVTVDEENALENSGHVVAPTYQAQAESEAVTVTRANKSAVKARPGCFTQQVDVERDKEECNSVTGKMEKKGTETVSANYYYGNCSPNLGAGGISAPTFPDFSAFPSLGSPVPGGGGTGPVNGYTTEAADRLRELLVTGCTNQCERGVLDALGKCLKTIPECAGVYKAAKIFKLKEAWDECYKGSIKACKNGLKEDAAKKEKSKAVSCIKGVADNCISSFIPGYSCAKQISDCILAIADANQACKDLENMQQNAYGRNGRASSRKYWIEELHLFNECTQLQNDVQLGIMGDEEWLDVDAEEMARFDKIFTEGSDNDGYILQNEETINYKPESISKETFERFIERWNRSVKAGFSTSSDANSISLQSLTESIEAFDRLDEEAVKLGYKDYGELTDALVSYAESLDELAEEPASSSVCASITLQLSQTMTLTRQAFRGTLSVFNGNETKAMKDVKLTLEVRDSEGKLAGADKFQINTESLDKFSGSLEQGSTWTLAANETGVATILFIPTKNAAPEDNKTYYFGGTLSYLDPFTDLTVTRDLFPVELTVKPSPSLDLTYFMQRDIYGDDPLTGDVVEPMEPAEFAVLVNNTGNGAANNVQMITQRPQVVENERGLFVNFDLLGSQLNGKEQVLALDGTVATEFGTLPAHSTAYAQWWLTSTLLGHFTDYDIKATHVTDYGNENLSLLGRVTIHELIRSLKVSGSDGQSLAGFLVNDVADDEDMPDMIYLSDGRVEDVNVVSAATIVAQNAMTYTLKVSANAEGWIYGNVVDPTGGRQQLAAVVRQSDGKAMELRNFWQTDRTLRDGRDPLYENRLHFADFISSGNDTYVLTFSPVPDVRLEVEHIDVIPENSGMITVPVSTVTVRFNKAIDPATFGAEDVTLNCQGVSLDLSKAKFAQVSGTEYTIDLSALTAANGYYVLTVQTATITDVDGFTGLSGKKADWIQFVGGQALLTVTAAPVEGGTVLPESGMQDYGKTVTLKATPAVGYDFRSWMSGETVLSSQPEYAYAVNGDGTLVANFVLKRYDVTLSYDEAGGSVSGGGTGIYEHGQQLSFVATPAEGYAFQGWTLNGQAAGTEPMLSVVVDAPVSVTANFVVKPEGESHTARYDLHKGWNWVSFNVANSDLASPVDYLKSIGTVLEAVAGAESSLVNDSQYGWVGQLKEIIPTGSYKLKVTADAELALTGNVVRGDDNTITLNVGWNWMAYLPTSEMTPDEAFRMLVPESGDVVKGQDAFAVFDGSAWVGSLDKFLPGEGYQYFSESLKSFNYPLSAGGGAVSAKGNVLAKAVDMPSSWVYSPYEYADNMAVISRVYVNGQEAGAGRYVIGAFVGDECRGTSVGRDGLQFLTVHGGQEGEAVSFKLWDKENNVLLNLNEEVAFRDGLMGTLTNPLRLTADKATGVHLYNDAHLSIYPNPVKTRLFVRGITNGANVKVEILDMSGVARLRATGLSDDNGIDVSGMRPGVYLITVRDDAGTYRTKFIKE